MQGIGLIRIDAQNVPVHLLRPWQVTRLMMLQRCVECLFN